MGKEAGSVFAVKEEASKDALKSSTFENWLLKSAFSTVITYANFILAYFCLLIVIMTPGQPISELWILAYLIPLYLFFNWRNSVKEKARQRYIHILPTFVNAIASALSSGETLEQAFVHAKNCLEGDLKNEFDVLTSKYSLGAQLGALLARIDDKFPRTGLATLIFMLEEYPRLGAGISQSLKKIAETLALKEETEKKIRSSLDEEVGYVRIAILIILGALVPIGFALRSQIALLMEDPLKTPFYVLFTIMICGLLIITRITQIDFVQKLAMRPYVKAFMTKNVQSIEALCLYANTPWVKRKYVEIFCLVVAFTSAYVVSWVWASGIAVFIGFVAGFLLCQKAVKFILRGIVEDRLFDVIEAFPEILHIFIIGLNSGLNPYLTLILAQNSIRGPRARLLSQGFSRVRIASECGNSPEKAWRRLIELLPIEILADFSKLMVENSRFGESVVNDVVQLVKRQHDEKLIMIKGTTTGIGQKIIPITAVALLPFFLFVILAPLCVTVLNSLRA